MWTVAEGRLQARAHALQQAQQKESALSSTSTISGIAQMRESGGRLLDALWLEMQRHNARKRDRQTRKRHRQSRSLDGSQTIHLLRPHSRGSSRPRASAIGSMADAGYRALFCVRTKAAVSQGGGHSLLVWQTEEEATRDKVAHQHQPWYFMGRRQVLHQIGMQDSPRLKTASPRGEWGFESPRQRKATTNHGRHDFLRSSTTGAGDLETMLYDLQDKDTNSSSKPGHRRTLTHGYVDPLEVSRRVRTPGRTVR